MVEVWDLKLSYMPDVLKVAYVSVFGVPLNSLNLYSKPNIFYNLDLASNIYDQENLKEELSRSKQ